MDERTAPVVGNRSERRKEATRAKIIVAANALFLAKGYEATSLSDISTGADVAIRTIYLRFGSKAAILLAYFDDWLAEFVVQLIGRPTGESYVQMMESALGAMRLDGWTDNKSFDEAQGMHPLIEFIGEGLPEIAGHVMHAWVGAQDELTAAFRTRDGLGVDDLAPRILASAIFAAWMTSVLTFRDMYAGRATSTLEGHQIGVEAMRAYSEGIQPGHAR